MNYHINTILILQEFPKNSECPLCEIKKIVEEKIVNQFLNEAVMVDNYRKKVNEKGFCRHHTEMLFARENKLGLALQHTTRLTTLGKHIETPKNFKQAQKQAVFFEKNVNSCLICELIDLSMNRYYKTIAQMYTHEKGFKEIFNGRKGFCIEHYAKLLKNSDCAKPQTSEYLTSLSNLQKNNNDRIISELQWFCDKHDYRNQDKPWNNSRDALIRSIIKLHGNEGK